MRSVFLTLLLCGLLPMSGVAEPVKLSNLAAASSAAPTDITIVSDPTGAAAPKKITFANLKTSLSVPTSYVASLTAPAAGITVSGGTGTITIGLANGLASLEGLTGAGYAKTTGTDVWALTSTIPWADIASTPTTLAGYGITGVSGTGNIVLASGATISGASVNGVTLSGSGTLATTGGTLGTAAFTATSAYDASGAAATAQAAAVQRANHTGTQASSTITQATARILGRSTSGSGATEEITLGTGLSFAGTTLNASGGDGSTAYTLSAPAGDYTLVISDAQKLVQAPNGFALTIPANASVAFPIGTWVDIQILGTLATLSCEDTLTYAVGLDGNFTANQLIRVIKVGSTSWFAASSPLYLVNSIINVTGILKSSGSGFSNAVSAAAAGTDYVVPTGDGSGLTGITIQQAEAGSSITPVADGTYTVGIGGSQNGTITTVRGIITAVQEAQP